MNVDLTSEQIEQELEELIGEGEVKGKAKKEPKVKKTFVPLSKEEIDKLSRREQYEYKIELSKFKTEHLKDEYKSYKSKQTETSRSLETKKLIIMGRFLETQLHKRPDRKVQYMVVEGHLDQYLTDDCDRLLFGFPPLSKSDGAN
jgi:hypothetical protein